jgi:hypothetical protein
MRSSVASVTRGHPGLPPVRRYSAKSSGKLALQNALRGRLDVVAHPHEFGRDPGSSTVSST